MFNDAWGVVEGEDAPGVVPPRVGVDSERASRDDGTGRAVCRGEAVSGPRAMSGTPAGGATTADRRHRHTRFHPAGANTRFCRLPSCAAPLCRASYGSR